MDMHQRTRSKAELPFDRQMRRLRNRGRIKIGKREIVQHKKAQQRDPLTMMVARAVTKAARAFRTQGR